MSEASLCTQPRTPASGFQTTDSKPFFFFFMDMCRETELLVACSEGENEEKFADRLGIQPCHLSALHRNQG